MAYNNGFPMTYQQMYQPYTYMPQQQTVYKVKQVQNRGQSHRARV